MMGMMVVVGKLRKVGMGLVRMGVESGRLRQFVSF